MPRTVYVIRHAERIDNIDHGWQKRPEYRGFGNDNSPLSPRGLKQAAELNKWFANVHVDNIYSSPFDRTLQTSTIMIGDRNIPIKPDGAFLEALYLCRNPPSVRPFDDLKADFPLLDANYKASLDPWKQKFPKEPVGDDGCCKRVFAGMKHVLSTPGDLVIVGHGASIGAVIEFFTGEYTYVGQATVSKFVETSEGSNKYKAEYISNADHLSDKSNLRPW